MKKYIITIGVCLGIVLLSVLVSMGRVNSAKDALDANTGKLNDLQAKVDIALVGQTTADKELILSETGYDMGRVNADVAVAEEFMQKVFDWDTNAKYVKVREDLKKEYGLSDDSTFMTVFMPEPYVNVARDGTEYPQIDILGLNANYEEMDTQVRNIANGTYSYFARVKWYAKTADGATEATESMFLFDTNDDHELLNLEAYNIQ